MSWLSMKPVAWFGFDDRLYSDKFNSDSAREWQKAELVFKADF
jgi:hypothetical protein